MKETVIQASILALLKVHAKVAWAKRANSGAARLKGQYVRFGFPGCSDIIGQLYDGRFLAIEVKTDDGKPTEEQQKFLARVNRHKGVAGICRSVQDVDKLLKGA